jgi:hypothetical protein
MSLRLRLLAAGFMVLICASLTAVGFSLYSRFSEGASYRRDQEIVWHNVICLLEGATLNNTRATPDQRQSALLYYDQILVLAHAAPCPGR